MHTFTVPEELTVKPAMTDNQGTKPGHTARPQGSRPNLVAV